MSNSGKDQEYLTVGQAAELMGVSRQSVQRACVAGKLSYAVTPGGFRRIRRVDVENLLTLRTGPLASHPDIPQRKLPEPVEA